MGHEDVYAEACVAEGSRPTRGICICICALAVWNHLLVWVPLSKGIQLVVVLYLLRHYRRRSACIEVKSDPVLANVGFYYVIVVC